jgi:hypothetical protein
MAFDDILPDTRAIKNITAAALMTAAWIQIVAQIRTSLPENLGPTPDVVRVECSAAGYSFCAHCSISNWLDK